MKKGKKIGIGIAIVIAVVFFGIASVPEVLLESPLTEQSENQPLEEQLDMESIMILNEETKPTEQIKSPENEEEQKDQIDTPPEDRSVEKADVSPSEEEGQVIEITIRDGIGSRDK